MKLKVLKVLMLAAVFAAFSAVSLSSCIRDNVDTLDTMDGVESGKPAVLSFNPIIEDSYGTPSTRAYTGGDSELEPGDGAQGSQAVGKAEDRNIEHVRVLMYKSSTGELVENLEFADVTPEQMPLTANVQTGRYDFVFLINSTSDVVLKNKLDDEANYDNLSELVAMSITGGLNGGGGAYSTAMPMLQTVYGVEVLGNNRIRLPGSASILEDTWQINPVRIKARLSVAMKLTKQQYSDLDAMEFRLSNTASNSYLFPKFNGDEGRDGNTTYLIYFNNPLAFTEIDESDPEFTTLYWHRVLLPELLFEDKDDKTGAMYIGVSKGGKAMQAPICAPAETGFGYTLPRNTWLHLNVTVKDNELQVTPQVIPWNADVLDDVLFDGKYSLSATPDLMTFVPDGGEQTLEVTTDYPDGWEIASTPSWITLDTDSSDVPGTVAVKATVTASSSSRQGSFVISAGRMHKTIKVAQLATIADSPTPANVIPYVGAFWKHNQTGERLIRIARPMVKSDGTATTAKQQAIIDGSWSATVIEGKEWIVLDTEASEDGGTWTDRPMMKGNDPGFDSRFAVSGDAVSVGGVLTPETPEQGIYFRIGLKNTIAADAVRYGVILLAYTNNASTPVINYQRIFVRQGEADDYLMRPTDAGGVLTSRPKAVKYSPYNLTSPEFMGNGVSLSEKEFVDVRPELRNGPSLAGFTEYPSQAGGFFLWSDKSGVNVYNPSGSGVRTKINASLSGTWFGADNHIGHTGTTAENHESCPAGYRRMIDGNENEFYDAISVDRSEANQSLFSTAFGGANGTGNTNNSVYGYYADGFFDRGSVGTESSLNDRKNTAVGVGRSTVAYSGRLFYNPASNNSIFFPITGAVQISNGQLSFTGMQGVYFSSGRGTSNNMVWMLDVQQTVAKRSLVNGNHYSAPIRCVVDNTPTDVTKPTGGVLAPPGVLGVSAETGTLTLRGSKEYAGTEVETDSGFGTLFPETVYLANFKWGSTIAITAQHRLDGSFDATDVVWAPAEFGSSLPGMLRNISNAADSSTRWAFVPYVSSAVSPHPSKWPQSNTSAELAAGLGDPCKLADGGAWSDYAVPTGSPWNGTAYTTTTMPYVAPLSSIYGRRDATKDVSGNDDWSMFLPLSYHRNNVGETLLRNGYYWSNTSTGSNNASLLLFTDSSLNNATTTTSRAIGAAIRCVIPPINPDNYVHAAPGVVGIKESDLIALKTGAKQLGDPSIELTLKGSSLYQGTAASNATTTAQFGTLETEPVYMTYFKWGSMVAMIGGANGDAFSPDDVVWVNPEFTGTITNTWTSFTSAARSVTGDFDISPNPGSGHGDICATFNPNFRTPRGKPWNGWTTASAQWITTIPTNTGNIPSGGAMSTDGSGIFLPGSGQRSPQYGDVSLVNPITKIISSTYWSSTALNTTAAHVVKADSALITVDNSHLFNAALPVRCVPVVPGVRNVGTAPGVIGYIHRPGHPDHHKLTMDKDDDGDDTDGIVYVAYFKFGSLVATSSEKYIPFTSNDIVAWPSEWKSTTDNRAALNAAVTGTNATAWNKIPYVSFSATDITTYGRELMGHPSVANNAAKGDPCIYWAAKNGWGNWRMPTAKENVDFFGRAADASWNYDSHPSFTPSDFPGVWTAGTAPMEDHPGLGHFPVENVGSRIAFSESLPAAGHRSTAGSVYNRGSVGSYWSSTVYDNSLGYRLYFISTSMYSAYYNNFAYGNAVRCVPEDVTPPLPANMVQAPPGVLGIRKSDIGKTSGFSLTLKGSDTYKNTIVATDGTDATLEFGPMENEPVYAVYFKRGSAAAILGGTGNEFDVNDIVWINPEYTSSFSTETNPLLAVRDVVAQGGGSPMNTLLAFNTIPMSNTNYANATFWTSEAARLPLGQADPCTYVEGANGETYSMVSSTATTWGANMSYPFGQANITSGIYNVAGIKYDDNPASSTFSGIISADHSIYLPPAGTRTNTGTLSQGSAGNYMSTYMKNMYTESLILDQSQTRPVSSTITSATAALVRCVPTPIP